MEETIVCYPTTSHLDSMFLLAKFIADHRPSIPITLIINADDSTAHFPHIPSITYHRLPPTPTALPNMSPPEIAYEITHLQIPNISRALLQISQNYTIKAFLIDFFCNSAFQVSTALNFPTYFFFSSGGFGLCAFLYFPTIEETVDGDLADFNDFIRIPGCPLIHSSDFPKSVLVRHTNVYRHFYDTAVNMRKSAGIIVHSFDALEYRAKEAISNGLCVPDAPPPPPAYFIGPLIPDFGGADGGRHECLRWLDLQPSKSVIFLCFGRRGFFSTEQLNEMAIGLENSGYRFLWSVRSPPREGGSAAAEEEPDLDALLPEGFLERTKGRGFVVKSWAPQREVLSHDSVGGFVTHCGMASILEAVSYGVPMIAWPIYAEQRMNRAYVVKEMKLALPLDATVQEFLTAAELEKRIRELMDSVSGRELRHRAADMKAAATAAMRENGASVVALDEFIRTVFSTSSI